MKPLKPLSTCCPFCRPIAMCCSFCLFTHPLARTRAHTRTHVTHKGNSICSEIKNWRVTVAVQPQFIPHIHLPYDSLQSQVSPLIFSFKIPSSFNVPRFEYVQAHISKNQRLKIKLVFIFLMLHFTTLAQSLFKILMRPSNCRSFSFSSDLHLSSIVHLEHQNCVITLKYLYIQTCVSFAFVFQKLGYKELEKIKG